MSPLFRRRPRADGYVKATNAFICSKCDIVAKRNGQSVKYASEKANKMPQKKRGRKVKEEPQEDVSTLEIPNVEVEISKESQ